MNEEISSVGTPESQTSHSIEELPAQLGFFETVELQQLRAEIVDAVTAGDWPLIHRLRSQYAQLGEEVVDGMEDEARERANIGLTVLSGLIMKAGGRTENYASELKNAHLQAWNRRYDNEAAIIETALTEVGEVPISWPERESKPPPKRQLSDKYLSELDQLVSKFEITPPPADISLHDNHLAVGGRSLQASDGPAVLWQALVSGREVIAEGLQSYREKMRVANPDKTISPDTPLRVMHLANHPRDVLTPNVMNEISHSGRELHNIEDIQEEFHDLWKAVDASGLLAEIRLLSTRSGWLPVYLWARARVIPTKD